MAKSQPPHTHLHPSPQLLLDGEHAIVSVRTHIKILFGRLAISLLFVAVGVLVGATLASTATPRLVIAGVTLVAVAIVLAKPLLQWFFWTYTLTNVRLIEQRGVIKRSGRVIPLSRINDVAFEKDLNDRILGCGTLIVHDASEQKGLRLVDIPHIESFHRTISSLVLKAHGQDPSPGAQRTETKNVPDGDV
ncbi:MAG: PH domain-containing protein [Micrococcales bacterium]|nr:PH domain-containing protein [Micrococcales bacterium]